MARGAFSRPLADSASRKTSPFLVRLSSPKRDLVEYHGSTRPRKPPGTFALWFRELGLGASGFSKNSIRLGRHKKPRPVVRPTNVIARRRKHSLRRCAHFRRTGSHSGIACDELPRRGPTVIFWYSPCLTCPCDRAAFLCISSSSILPSTVRWI